MSKLVHNQKRSRRKGRQTLPSIRSADRGQAIVLVAIAMVAMLVATGLAVDGGVLLLRKAQLDRAVDAAARTGGGHRLVCIAHGANFHFRPVRRSTKIEFGCRSSPRAVGGPTCRSVRCGGGVSLVYAARCTEARPLAPRRRNRRPGRGVV